MSPGTQMVTQQAPPSYGATAPAVKHVANNPFATSYVEEEAVQPPAQDTYMHGTVNDRTY